MPHSVHSTPRGSPLDEMALSNLYWNINQPEEQWTEHCPEFLLGQSQRSIEVLSTKNEDFKRLSWLQVEDLVSTSSLYLS